MRTNIELNDTLIKKAMKLARARSKREAVHVALEEYVASRERKKILEMFGSDCIDPSYDHKAARAGEAR